MTPECLAFGGGRHVWVVPAYGLPCSVHGRPYAGGPPRSLTTPQDDDHPCTRQDCYSGARRPKQIPRMAIILALCIACCSQDDQDDQNKKKLHRPRRPKQAK